MDTQHTKKERSQSWLEGLMPWARLAFEATLRVKGWEARGRVPSGQAWKSPEMQPGNSYFSRVCVIHFLVNLSWGLTGNVTIAPKSPKGELGPLRLVSPVAYRTHIGLPRCGSTRNSGGHSRGLDQPGPAARLSPHALLTSQRGFKNSGVWAQAHPLPPPATGTRLAVPEFSARRLQGGGQSHGADSPSLPVSRQQPGLLFLADSLKIKKPQGCWKWLHQCSKCHLFTDLIFNKYLLSCFFVPLEVMLLIVLPRHWIPWRLNHTQESRGLWFVGHLRFLKFYSDFWSFTQVLSWIGQTLSDS